MTKQDEGGAVEAFPVHDEAVKPCAGGCGQLIEDVHEEIAYCADCLIARLAPMPYA